MGQQQLLLIILGVIIVGIAIAVGITLFKDSAVSTNRDAMANDMMHLAAKARHYYKRPTSMGGGGHSFMNLGSGGGILLLVSSNFSTNDNGTYSIKSGTTQTLITFVGTGKAPLDNGSFPIMECVVTPSAQTISTVN
ncbi:MAG: hypothetical protein WCX28_05500 [Bacteriovoracaceae bacterium]|nr:hypothetical protein [Bacteroidota bacterium]